MPDSSSALLGLRLQALGENLNTWGDPNLNNNFSRLEEAICGAVSIAVEANVTLTSTDYVTNQARYMQLNFTGSGGFNVTAPATAKVYLVKNDCAAAVTLTHGSGDTVSVAAGAIKWVGTDGSDFYTPEEIDFLPLTGGAITGNLTISGTLGVTGATTLTALASYASDLSGSYTNRSLVDKEYVDGLAFSAVDLPGQAGQAGKYLTTDGTNASWDDVAVDPTLAAIAALTTANGNFIYATGVDTFTQITSTARGRNELTKPAPSHVNNAASPYSASFGEEIFVDCSTGAVEIDLPAATAGSLPIRITDDDGQAATNNITLDPDGSETIAGETSIEIDQARASVWLVPFAGLWRLAK